MTVLSVPAALAALRLGAASDVDDLMAALRDRSPEFRRTVDGALGRHVTSSEFGMLSQDQKLAIFTRHFGVRPGQRGESPRTTVLRALLAVAESDLLRNPPQVVLPQTAPVRPVRPYRRATAEPAPTLVTLLAPEPAPARPTQRPTAPAAVHGPRVRPQAPVARPAAPRRSAVA